MSPKVGFVAWSACALVLAFPFAAGDAEEGPVRYSVTPATVSVEQWLVLGPVADALPVFHDESPGGYAMEAMRAAARFPVASLRPAEGRMEQWFGGMELQWTVQPADAQGMMRLEPPTTTVAGHTAVAWLAAYVEVDRFSALSITLKGNHLRTFMLDGVEVAHASGSEIDKKSETKLIAGKHLLIVEAIRDSTSDAPWTVGLALEASNEAANVGLSLDPTRDVTIYDIIDAPTISSVSISPDGALVAAAVGRYLPGTDDRESWVEVRSTQSGDLVRTWRGGEMGQVSWAPSGRTLSYVTSHRAGGEQRSTLWLADMEANTVVPLLERVDDFEGYRWAPDGNSIVYMTSVSPDEDPRGIKRLEGLMDRWATYRTKTYLNLVTLPGGTTRRLTAGSLTTDFGGFSPDGTRLLFTREVEDLSERPFSRTELWELNLTTL